MSNVQFGAVVQKMAYGYKIATPERKAEVDRFLARAEDAYHALEPTGLPQVLEALGYDLELSSIGIDSTVSLKHRDTEKSIHVKTVDHDEPDVDDNQPKDMGTALLKAVGILLQKKDEHLQNILSGLRDIGKQTGY